MRRKKYSTFACETGSIASSIDEKLSRILDNAPDGEERVFCLVRRSEVDADRKSLPFPLDHPHRDRDRWHTGQVCRYREDIFEIHGDRIAQIGRAHVLTPVTVKS